MLSRIWLPLTTLQMHITHGLQLPSFTALRHTHSHPPLHQSHSCHQSLTNPDCFTTPAPHSHTHIEAAHFLALTAKSCSCAGWHFWAFTHPSDCDVCVWPRTALPWNSEPVLVTSTPRLVLFTSLPCLLYSCFCPLTIACLILPLSNK